MTTLNKKYFIKPFIFLHKKTKSIMVYISNKSLEAMCYSDLREFKLYLIICHQVIVK